MRTCTEPVVVPRRQFDCGGYSDCLLKAALRNDCIFECPAGCGQYQQGQERDPPAFFTWHAVVGPGELFDYITENGGGAYGHGKYRRAV